MRALIVYDRNHWLSVVTGAMITSCSNVVGDDDDDDDDLLCGVAVSCVRTKPWILRTQGA